MSHIKTKNTEDSNVEDEFLQYLQRRKALRDQFEQRYSNRSIKLSCYQKQKDLTFDSKHNHGLLVDNLI